MTATSQIPASSVLIKRQTTVDQLATIVAALLEELGGTLNQLVGLNLVSVLQGSLSPLGAALNEVAIFEGGWLIVASLWIGTRCKWTFDRC